MSLPTPTTTGSGGKPAMSMNPKQLQAMEAPMIALANSAGGDLRMLMYAFFSFLHRRTDFYLVPNDEDLKEGKARMGFPEGEAEKLLLAAFRQFPLRRMPRQQSTAGSSGTTSPGTTASSTTTTTAATKSTTPTKPSASPSPESAPNKEAAAASTTAKTTKGDESEQKTDANDKESDAIRYTEEGLQVPIGNGGSTKRYKWTQTLDECTVMLGIPNGMRAKELDVSIKPSSIHVKTKKKAGDEDVTTFVEGTLVEKVKPDESTWSLEGGVIMLILYKVKKTFWQTIIEGDEKIDTELVDSRRHIQDYDEATQGQLRKIMFDQKQQEKGLPTSDEITGEKTIPKMPPGVEYIDKTTFENKN